MNTTSSSNIATLEKTTSSPHLPNKAGVPGQKTTPKPMRLLHWVWESIPTLIILLILSALAWWGHHTGWKLNSFAELTGQASESKDDWCQEHGVPESQCALCTPNLIPKSKSHGWCSVHGVHNCPLEHPDVIQVHSTPKISEEDRARAKRALEFTHRQENNSRCKLHPALVQLSSKEDVDSLGLKFEPVWTSPIEEIITANGEIVYDQTRTASLASIVPGRVWRVQKQAGDQVKKGDVLAYIDALEVGKAKAALLQALAEVNLRKQNVDRLKPLSGTAVAAAKILEEESALVKAEANLVSTEQALNNLGIPVQSEQFVGLNPKEQNKKMQFLGLPKAFANTLDATTTTANLIAVRSSLDGVVVERNVVEGEMVNPTRSLFIVADTRTMWLNLFVRGEDAKYVKLGQKIGFRFEGSEESALGKISWVSTALDEKTRMLKVRADLANPLGELRASTFGTGVIELRVEANAIVVPNKAIHWDGNCNVVFVQDKDFHNEGNPKVFHVRNIRPGAINGEQTEIIAGVWPGEIVVTEGSGVLRSQLLRNNLGAG